MDRASSSPSRRTKSSKSSKGMVSSRVSNLSLSLSSLILLAIGKQLLVRVTATF